MSLYDIDYDIQAERMLPTHLRKEKQLEWWHSLLYPLQWLRDRIFDEYKDGGLTAIQWDSLTSYVIGDIVRSGGSLYYAVADSLNVAVTDTDYWYLLQDNFIGVIPRIKYNASQLLLEFVLNQWFGSSFVQPTASAANPDYYLPKSDIYIETNQVQNLQFVVSDDIFYTSSVSNLVSQTTAVTDTYTFNPYAFSVNVPVALWALIASNDPDREAIVRAQVDKYNLIGLTYEINTY